MPVQFVSTVKKGAYFAAVVLRTTVGVLGLLGVASAVRWTYGLVVGRPVELTPEMFTTEVVADPIVVVALLVAAYMFVRQVLFRLGERDVHRSSRP